MGQKLKKILRSIIFISIGIALFYIVYRQNDFHKIFSVLKQAKLSWILLSMAMGLFSHYLRSIRWKLLIKPLGYNPRTSTLFYSVMIMYLTNLAIPRSGEVVRCATASKYEKIPFSSLLGTVVTERIIDFIMLFILLGITILTQSSYLLKFLDIHPEFAQVLNNLKHSSIFLGLVTLLFIALGVAVYAFRKKLRKIKLIDKIFKLIDEFWNGLKTVAHLEKKALFIVYTIGIWTLYFLMIFVVFKAFDFTKHLSILAGLTIFVLSSFGMVFPSPGGMGSWHFMAQEALRLYGIQPDPYGATFALAAHESQMLMLIVAGFFSLLALSFVKNKNNNKTTENEQQK